MIYISSPYSHPNPVIREFRYHTVEQYTAACMANGEFVFSPIVHCHNMAVRYRMPTDHEFWLEMDKKYIQTSSGIRVLKMAGWTISRGVKFEMEYANEIGKPVMFVTAREMESTVRVVAAANGR